MRCIEISILPDAIEPFISNFKDDNDNWKLISQRLLLYELGFYEVWVQQGVGNYNVFISLFKQRLTDNYVQNTNARLQTHSRARFFNLFGSFQFHDYLNLIRVPKY